MVVKKIKFTDYNGVEREEDFYFNLNKAEILNLQFSVNGGLYETLKKISMMKDDTQIVKFIQDIILKSYGEKSPDGRQFVKSEELMTNFMQTEAYSELLIELMSDAKKMGEFVRALMPQDVAKNLPDNIEDMDFEDIEKLKEN